MAVDVSQLPGPNQVSPNDLAERVLQQHARVDLRGAFPIVVARPWRHRVARLRGAVAFVPGQPFVAAAVGRRLWLYRCAADLDLHELVTVVHSDHVTPIENPHVPAFSAAQQTAQVGLDWFDQARFALARMRRGILDSYNL